MPTSITNNPDPKRGMMRLGKIRKGGEKAQSKTGYGEDLDHFRITLEPHFAAYAPLITQIYGARPNDLLIKTLAPMVFYTFEDWYEEYGSGGKLKRQCDQTHQHQHLEDGAISRDPIACAAPSCACALIGRLYVTLPEFQAKTGLFGYFTLETGSVRDVAHIYNALNNAAAHFGSLQNIVFRLSRVQEASHSPQIKDGKRTGKVQNTQKYFVKIRPDEDFVRAYMLSGGAQNQLPAHVDPETGEVNGQKQLAAPTNDTSQVDTYIRQADTVTVSQSKSGIWYKFTLSTLEDDEAELNAQSFITGDVNPIQLLTGEEYAPGDEPYLLPAIYEFTLSPHPTHQRASVIWSVIELVSDVAF